MKLLHLFESIQSIVNLRVPKLLAKLLFNKFGKNAYTVSKWFTEYYSYGRNNSDFDRNFGTSYGPNHDTIICLKLLNAMDIGEEEYVKVSKQLGFDGSGFGDTYHERELRKELEENFFNATFFKSEIIRDLINGKIKNLKQYENLTFEEADNLYSEKTTYTNKKPFKVYDTGFKWVNVGTKSKFIARGMKNCGSTGVMGCDPDRTMFVLFDKNDKPHVITTYSPNERKIHGIEGVAGSEVKQEYIDYTIDLAKTLKVKFDDSSNKAPLAWIKLHFGSEVEDIKKIGDDISQIKLKNGQEFYSNKYSIAPKHVIDDVIKSQEFAKSNSMLTTLEKKIQQAFVINKNNNIRLPQSADYST